MSEWRCSYTVLDLVTRWIGLVNVTPSPSSLPPRNNNSNNNKAMFSCCTEVCMCWNMAVGFLKLHEKLQIIIASDMHSILIDVSRDRGYSTRKQLYRNLYLYPQ
jgi:hypothetical protein